MVAERMLPERMFADSMLETSWAQQSRRSWTTLASFGLEAVVVGLLLLIPLLTTVGVPSVRTVSTPISAGRPDPGPAPQVHGTRSNSVQIVPVTSQIMLPRRIPQTIPTGDDSSSAQPPAGCVGCVGAGPGTAGGVDGLPISGLLGGSHVVPLAPVVAPPTRAFRTSQIMEGSLIRRIQPVYPVPARTMRVQGTVVLYALISKSGTIENLRVLSGHPLLAPAAIDAVSQWRYRPYILNNEPIEVETQITVNFILGN
jgi:protein TonB